MNKYYTISRKIVIILGYLFIFWILLLVGIINFIPESTFSTIYEKEMLNYINELKKITTWLFWILLIINISLYIPIIYQFFNKLDNKLKSKKRTKGRKK